MTEKSTFGNGRFPSLSTFYQKITEYRHSSMFACKPTVAEFRIIDRHILAMEGVDHES